MSNSQLFAQIEQVWSIDPAARAIEFKGAWITWGELRAAALRIDALLTAEGIGRGAAVGILLRNQPGLIAALLAILVSDRCVISLSPFQSAASIAADVGDFQLPAVIASAVDWDAPELHDAAAKRGCLGIAVGGESLLGVRAVTTHSAHLEHHPALPGTALEILTSGTTGTPKRIRISYDTMQDAIFDGAVSAGREGRATVKTLKAMPTILAAPLMHVSGIFGALLPIMEGRPIVLLEKFEVAPWVGAVVRHGIKFTSLPPTPMRMVLDAAVPREKLASLVAVRAGTAPLSAETQRQFEAAYGVPVLVQYGATEWMGGIAGWTLDEHRKFIDSKLGSVGRAHAGTKLRVVDPVSGAEVAPGDIGVLEVMPQKRLGATDWTRTSDLASIDRDNFLYIHGRADDTIIRGGFKVLLSHVADVLARHERVREAAVIGLPDARLGQVPVAAIERKADLPAPTAAELESFARAHLKPYEVPVRFLIVDELPRTVSMKVIRPQVKAMFAA